MHVPARALLLIVFAPLAFGLTSCSPFSVNLGVGTDPCLLQQYQARSFSAVREMRQAVTALSGSVDALKEPAYAISTRQDVYETLATLIIFVADIHTQWNLLQAGPHPLEGRTFDRQMREAVTALDTGASLLQHAYLASLHQHRDLAHTLALGGRVSLRQGRIALALAGEALATLHTYSTNC